MGLTLDINGSPHRCKFDARTPLIDELHEGLALTGTRIGCREGQCGACHVLVDGRSEASCQLTLGAAQGCTITTVEALPEALRTAFAAEQAAQCAYCSSGMLVSAAALLRHTPTPDAAQVRRALDRHLCRCGAHNRIIRAVLRAAAMLCESPAHERSS